jgi:putative membrane protein insertion efficiency factor
MAADSGKGPHGGHIDAQAGLVDASFTRALVERSAARPWRSQARRLMALHSIMQVPRLAGRALVKAYRYSLAAFTGGRCRHLPTCSEFADEAIGRFGLWAGGWMTLARICRCHPWGTSGLDFVPAALPARARWYLPWRYGRWRGTNATAC